MRDGGAIKCIHVSLQRHGTDAGMRSPSTLIHSLIHSLTHLPSSEKRRLWDTALLRLLQHMLLSIDRSIDRSSPSYLFAHSSQAYMQRSQETTNTVKEEEATRSSSVYTFVHKMDWRVVLSLKRCCCELLCKMILKIVVCMMAI